MLDLTTPPPPLSKSQRRTFWIVSLICAATRFLARAKTLWDWDEALFCLGMRSYDVTHHHPHPPGFPTYIALGRVARLFTGDDFRALQSINLIAAVLLFPAVFLVARELRLRFEVAVAAGALCAFFPNVWFFGGGAFSDIPSIVTVLFAVALLMRGCRDRASYIAGAAILAVAAGMRPQNLVIGLWPGLVATRYRMQRAWSDVAVAAAVGAAIVGGAFGIAAHASGGLEPWLRVVRDHGRYISSVDSFHNPARPPLWRIFDRFFLKQYDSPALSTITSIFVFVSVVGAIRRRDRRIGFIALTFLPFAISAWLMLDRFSISRFSIGYIPLFAILAADGIFRVVSQRPIAGAVVTALLAGGFAAYTIPALNTVRREIAPTVAGVEAAVEHLDPAHDQLYVAGAMIPFVDYLGPRLQWIRVNDDRALPLSEPAKRPWLLAEIDRTTPHGVVFERRRGTLWNIARRHYFEVALEPLTERAEFAAGWYPPEREGVDESRWMGARSVTRLPPAAGSWRLRLGIEIPSELVDQHPIVTVRVNGKQIDRSPMTAAEKQLDLDFDLPSPPAPSVMEIEIDHTLPGAHNGSDARDLGLRLHTLGWGPY